MPCKRQVAHGGRVIYIPRKPLLLFIPLLLFFFLLLLHNQFASMRASPRLSSGRHKKAKSNQYLEVSAIPPFLLPSIPPAPSEKRLMYPSISLRARLLSLKLSLSTWMIDAGLTRCWDDGQFNWEITDQLTSSDSLGNWHFRVFCFLPWFFHSF